MDTSDLLVCTAVVIVTLIGKFLHNFHQFSKLFTKILHAVDVMERFEAKFDQYSLNPTPMNSSPRESDGKLDDLEAYRSLELAKKTQHPLKLI